MPEQQGIARSVKGGLIFFGQPNLRLWLLILGVFCTLFKVNGQNHVIDTLKFLYNQESDLAKKSALATDLAWEFLYINPNKTFEYAKEGLMWADSADYPFGKATSEGTFGLYYDVVGDYEKAIEHYLNAVKVLESLQNVNQNLASNYSNLSLIFNSIENNEKAIYYAHKALNYEITGGNKVGEIYSYINLGVFHRANDNLDSSIFYHQLAIKEGVVNNLDDYKIDLINLGNLYLTKGNLDSASSYFFEFLEFAKNLNPPSKYRVAHAYAGLANLNIALKRPEAAKYYIDSAWAINADLENRDFKLELLSYYFDYYKLKNNYKEATEILQKANLLSDSLNSLTLKESIENLEVRFQNEQKQVEIEKLKAQNKIQDLTIEKTKNRVLFMVILLVLSALIITISIVFLNNQRKSSKALAEKNKIIENLIRESHHRIKNNLQVVSSLLNLQSLSLNSAEAEAAIHDAQSRVKSIALLHQRLQGSKDFKNIELRSYLPELLESVLHSLQGAENKTEVNYEIDEVSILTDKAISIGLIVNEFITNSFKYAQIEGQELKIMLSFKRDLAGFKLLYKDNGPGLPKDYNAEDENSLGFNIIKSLCAQLNGQYKLVTEEGFSAQISIPNE